MVNLKQYVTILDQYKIAYTSIFLAYDTKTNSKRAIHPIGWRNITFDKRIFNPKMNAIMQITGVTSGIVVIDIDGEQNTINQELIQSCIIYCKFYNKTRKGYHFFFQYDDSLPSAFSIKYHDDPNNAGLDFKTTGGCLYYGSYKIGDQIIKYENITSEAIEPLPKNILERLLYLSNKKDQHTQRKTTKCPHVILNTTHDFPNTVIVDIDTIDKIIKCFPHETFKTYNNWIRICYLIKQTNHYAFQVFFKYSRSVSQYANVSEAECLIKWNSVKYNPNFNYQTLLHLARKANIRLFNSIQLPWIDFSNSNNTLFTPIIFNSQYIDYEFIMQHINSNGSLLSSNTNIQPHITGIISPYGTGKTVFLSKYFAQLPPTTSILFITSRVTLSYSTKQAFPTFSHYQDKNIKNLKHKNKLIIQLDSLYKLDHKNTDDDLLFYNPDEEIQVNQYIPISDDPDNKTVNTSTYDIIALDEIESLLFHLSFKKLKTQYIYKILTKICSKAKYIIALDGDLGNRSYTFLQSLCTSGQKPIILLNQFKTIPKHYIFNNNYKTFEKQIDDSLTAGQNIVIVSMTMKHSEYFYNKYYSKYPTILHNSIQNNREGLTDINTYWQTARLLIYTSTIQEGCDFNVKWFDKLFVILSNKSTTPRSLLQMNGRVRNYKENNIYVFTNSVPFYEYQYPYQLEEVAAYMKRQLGSNQLSPLDTILAYNEVESLNRNYFITILTSILRSKGHTYEYQRTEKVSKPRLPNDIYQEIADAININNQGEYNSAIDSLKTIGLSTITQRAYYYSIKKYLISKIWEIDIESITIDDVKSYYPRIQKLLNYKFFITYVNTPTTSYKNIILSRKIAFIQSLIAKFGVLHPGAFDFSIQCGISKQGRKRNSKENPLIISSTVFKEHLTSIRLLLENNDNRMLFELAKLEPNTSDRKVLEILKKIIGEFGFVIKSIQKDSKIFENGSWKTGYCTNYLIDLEEEMIDLFNRNTNFDIDQIINGDDEVYMNSYYDGEIEDDMVMEDSDSESEVELIF